VGIATLPIAECRLKIDELPMVECRLPDCRLAIGVVPIGDWESAGRNQQSSMSISIRQSSIQSSFVNEQSAFGIRQSVNLQSAIRNRQ
jgi:hypothetical protein